MKEKLTVRVTDILRDDRGIEAINTDRGLIFPLIDGVLNYSPRIVNLNSLSINDKIDIVKVGKNLVDVKIMLNGQTSLLLNIEDTEGREDGVGSLRIEYENEFFIDYFYFGRKKVEKQKPE